MDKIVQVSVVIPIYNVRNYIKRGISVIQQQSFKNLEIIMVDDGSKDGSGEACEELASVYDNLRVFHKKNEGCGLARNMGLDNAKGDYVYFFDIDDEADSYLIEKCVSIMEEKLSDMMVFGFDVYNNKGVKTSYSFPEYDILSNSELRISFLDRFLFPVKDGNGFCWNKFYRRSFLEKYHLRFGNQRIQQDEVFNLKCYQKAEHVYISPEVLYTYYIYDKGNTRSRFIPDRFDIYVSVRDHFENLRKLWDIQDSRFDNYLNNRFFSNIGSTLRFNLFHPNCLWSYKEKKKEMERVMTHPYTKEAMEWKGCNLSGFEDKLYFRCYLHQNLMELYVYYKIFGLLRKFKHFFCK